MCSRPLFPIPAQTTFSTLSFFRIMSLCLVFFGTGTLLFSQKKPIKFGKVDLSDLQMADCAFEPGASAMVLCDYGLGDFDLSQNDEWTFTFSCHKRIKIFTKEGLDAANISLRYYAGKTGRYEQISRIKAACYYLEQGTVRQVELASRDIFTTKLSHDYREVKFAIPGAREGCVVEYTYEYSTQDLSNLKSWYFQEDIPVLYSECQMIVPNYFRFQNVLRGGHGLDVNEETATSRTFHGSMDARTAGLLLFATTADCKQTRWVMKNLGSMHAERYIGALRDYTAHIEFQLLGIQPKSRAFIEVMPSYEQFSNKLLDDETFGKVAEPGGFEKDLTRKIIADIPDPREWAAAILKHIQERISWTGEEDIYVDRSPSKVYSEGKGSVAEINLLLTACLRAAGLKADPVLLGTRDHGRPHPVYPKADRFNYVIVAIDLDGKVVLADATCKEAPLGYISPVCLNGEGWRVSAGTPGWVQLQDHAAGIYSSAMTIQLNNGVWEGKVSVRITGYTATQTLTQIGEEGKESVLKTWQQNIADWNPGAFDFHQQLQQGVPVVVCEAPVRQEVGETDIIYLQQHFNAALTANPFSAEKRELPIDFPYAQNFNFALQIPIPDGYIVSEIPQSTRIAFGENRDLTFQYQCDTSFNMITVVSRFQMNRLLFVPEEYPELRQFFDMMIQKNQEMIVLKKRIQGK